MDILSHIGHRGCRLAEVLWIYVVCLGVLEGLVLHYPNGTTVQLRTPYSNTQATREGAKGKTTKYGHAWGLLKFSILDLQFENVIGHERIICESVKETHGLESIS